MIRLTIPIGKHIRITLAIDTSSAAEAALSLPVATSAGSRPP
jgi:hypothetical protein